MPSTRNNKSKKLPNNKVVNTRIKSFIFLCFALVFSLLNRSLFSENLI